MAVRDMVAHIHHESEQRRSSDSDRDVTPDMGFSAIHRRYIGERNLALPAM